MDRAAKSELVGALGEVFKTTKVVVVAHYSGLTVAQMQNLRRQMKHAGATALMVVDAQTGQPAGIITEADVAHAIADGKDVNDVWAGAVMTTRPAVTTTTSIHDAAKIMTARHFRHLPVEEANGLLGVVDILDVCQALINTEGG